jgi:hypothetical protein
VPSQSLLSRTTASAKSARQEARTAVVQHLCVVHTPTQVKRVVLHARKADRLRVHVGKQLAMIVVDGLCHDAAFKAVPKLALKAILHSCC